MNATKYLLFSDPNTPSIFVKYFSPENGLAKWGKLQISIDGMIFVEVIDVISSVENEKECNEKSQT